jgi:ATP-binding cassette subfamily F protein uup
MLQPADLLLLDEPTNDLDIPTLEILEETLLEYPGALVLITHDRYMLDRIANIVIGLDGEGHAATFADYPQWEAWLEQQERQKKEQSRNPTPASEPKSEPVPLPSAKKKLSYLEAREWATLETRLAEAEKILGKARAKLEDPSVSTDAARLQSALADAEEAQQSVDALFTRWAELEAKQA